jgi:hypothetical protein
MSTRTATRTTRLFRRLRRQLIVVTRALRRRRPSRLERYLTQAIDHADLEQRVQQAERLETRGLW